MEILGVIPARGGSKSIPRKNIKPLLGRPLIAWTIQEAKKSKLMTRVIVSTDDEEIAQVARAHGAEVPFIRPVDIAGDMATDVEFLIHALDWLKDNEGYEPEMILRLPPTSPLRRAEHIDQGILTLQQTPGADASRPICEAPKHPYKLWKIGEDGVFLEPFLPKSFTGFDEPYNLPRQMFPKAYIHTGAMDVMWTRTVREMKSTSGKKLVHFFMTAQDSVNIDHPIDFEIAEFLIKKRQGNEETNA